MMINDYMMLYLEVRRLNKGKATLEQLSCMAKNDRYEIRYWVSSQPNTPIHILIDLFHDKNDIVKYSAFENPNLPEEYKMLYLMES